MPSLKVEKQIWPKIQDPFGAINKNGLPDNLFEAKMDFLYLMPSWLEAHWTKIGDTN
jgi:hypothetical protein